MDNKAQICFVSLYFSAVLLNIPFNFLYGVILTFTGLVIYAYFDNERCDPLLEGVITNSNQVCFCCGLLYLPLYVFACLSLGFIFILDSRLAIFGGRNCSFGFLLVVFSLSCHCFKCVLLSF